MASKFIKLFEPEASGGGNNLPDAPPKAVQTLDYVLRVPNTTDDISWVNATAGSGSPNSWADYALSNFVETNTVDGNLVVTLDFTENSIVTRVYRQVITSPYTDIIFSDEDLTTEITRR